MHHPIPGAPGSLKIAKAQAKRLRAALNDTTFLKPDIVHGQALELVAKLHGFESWGHLVANIGEKDRQQVSAGNGADPPFPPIFSLTEDQRRPDPVISGVSFWFLLRTIYAQCEESRDQFLLYAISGALDRAASTPEIMNAPVNLLAKPAFGGNPSCHRLRLIDGIRLSDLIEMVYRPVPHMIMRDPAGLMEKMIRQAFDRLLDSRSILSKREVASGASILLEKTVVPSGHGEDLRAWAASGKTPLLDCRHTRIYAPDAARARRIASMIDPEVHDLTVADFDSVRFMDAFGLPHIGFRFPEDMLSWVTAFMAENINRSFLKERKTLSILIPASIDDSGLDVRLAQVRSFGIHIFVWMDEHIVKADETLILRIQANTRSLIIDKGDGTGPRIWTK